MSYSTYLCVTLATLVLHPSADTAEAGDATPALDDILQPVLELLQQLVERFRRTEVSPVAAAGFEEDLQQAARELARVVTQWTYNHLEPNATPTLPRQVEFESSSFRRLSKKTP